MKLPSDVEICAQHSPPYGNMNWHWLYFCNINILSCISQAVPFLSSLLPEWKTTDWNLPLRGLEIGRVRDKKWRSIFTLTRHRPLSARIIVCQNVLVGYKGVSVYQILRLHIQLTFHFMHPDAWWVYMFSTMVTADFNCSVWLCYCNPNRNRTSIMNEQ